MLSYQHAYHAGGPADVHKHRALAALLSLMAQDPEPMAFLESHAGRGLYFLDGPEAEKTGEWRSGIAGVEASDHPYWRAIEATCAAHGPMAYPGSPAIAQALLRPQDRTTLYELHPTEHAALQRAMGGPGVSIRQEDGVAAFAAMRRPKPRRGVALIDPSYEVKTDYAEIGTLAAALADRWTEICLIVWYPILPAARHADLLDLALAAEAPRIHDEIAFPPHRGRGMTGSGLLIFNPPEGAKEALT